MIKYAGASINIFIKNWFNSPVSHKRWNLKLETTAGGEGNVRIVGGFINAIKGIAPPLTTARESLCSDLMAFVAEKSVKTEQVEKIIR